MKTLLILLLSGLSLATEAQLANKIFPTSAAFRALGTNISLQQIAAQLQFGGSVPLIITSPTNILGSATTNLAVFTNTPWSVTLPAGQYLSSCYLNVAAGTNLTGINLTFGNGVDTVVATNSAPAPTNSLTFFQQGVLLVTETNAYTLSLGCFSTNGTAPYLTTNSFWVLTSY
jgi:hypothetical protein